MDIKLYFWEELYPKNTGRTVDNCLRRKRVGKLSDENLRRKFIRPQNIAARREWSEGGGEHSNDRNSIREQRNIYIYTLRTHTHSRARLRSSWPILLCVSPRLDYYWCFKNRLRRAKRIIVLQISDHTPRKTLCL